jgi:multiple sugar transport system substrate-binding protein
MELKALVLIFMVLVTTFPLFAGGNKDQKTAAGKIELVVFGHMVHQTAMEGVDGGGKNLVQEFIALHPEVGSVRFITAGVSEIRDKLFREASLPRTEFNLSFVYTPWISPAMPEFFVPLDDYLAKSPIEDYNDIFGNLRDELAVGGKSYGVPMRASGQGLYYNKKILAERGITNPPATVEELIEDIRKCSFTRSNGEDVYGYVKQGIREELPFVVGDFIRAKDGDFLTAKYEPRFSDPRVIEYLDLFRELLAIKALPPNFIALEDAGAIELFKRNRGAFTTAGPGHLVRFTGADGLSADDVGFMNFPVSAQTKSAFPVAGPTVTFQWAFVIPKGAQNKDLVWEFIRFMTGKEGVLNMSLSGNEPFRDSTFQDSRYTSRAPYLTQQLNIFKYGRPLFRGFDNFPEARDILGGEIQQVIAGQKSAQQAMADAEKRIIPLLPYLVSAHKIGYFVCRPYG